MTETLRGLPAVHRLLSEAALRPYESLLGPQTVKRIVRQALERARHAQNENGTLLERVVADLEDERLRTLIPAINATGVLLHTNLGRTPVARGALDAAAAVAVSYSNLEYDLRSGERASRHERLTALLQSVTGAPDGIVVNNCAAAVLLILDTFAKGRDVVVARNQLVEIGGGFRIPDVLERSGAALIEVGSTNKVRLADYERAFSARTSLVLRTHASNFRMTGFTEDVWVSELAQLCQRSGVPLVEDLGSGALVDLEEYGLPHERTVADALRDGARLVAFSGDKLLGGPQAGIIVGNASLVARMRANPLVRALRVDKITLALLAATLNAYRSREAREQLPLYRMLAATLSDLRVRAQRYARALAPLAAEVVETRAFLGAGALPESALPSIGVRVRTSESAASFTARLRHGDPAIVARIERDAVVFDVRAIAPEEDDIVLTALRTLS